MMDMFGKTLATTGAAWLCLLVALVVFDYVQDAFNHEYREIISPDIDGKDARDF
jgi:hypothetical protein